MDKSSKAKKQKLNDKEADKKDPPAYGSQTYWEERYKKTRALETSQVEEPEDITEGDDALSYHSWYFTYEDLRPLILPLILGGRDEGLKAMGASERELEPEPTKESSNETRTKTDEPAETTPENEQAEESKADGEDEFVSDEEVASDEEDEEELVEREGLAKDGPISLIEIGCGDVPLGSGVALDLSKMGEKAGARADSIVETIVCCDYSPSVIELCKENQNGLDNTNRPGLLVKYVTADARSLPYPKDCFHLVLEKGTLDAMLSDKQSGIASSRQIVAECARILKDEGYIMLVSHLNAHTSGGIEWLNDVVISGLRDGKGQDSRWEIEVHGSDVQDESSEPDDDEKLKAESAATPKDSGIERVKDEDYPPPSGGPGPAVYIIHNKPKAPSDDSAQEVDAPTVPLKFFSY